MARNKTRSLVPVERIKRKILRFRQQNVMLDSDLAELYGITTGRLNQAVQRNAERFPDDFAFRLESEEYDSLISQTVISKPRRGGRRTLPWVFNEHGVAMLSSVLRTPKAVQVNIAIVRAFVQLRTLLSSNAHLARRVEAVDRKADKNYLLITQIIRELKAPPPAKKNDVPFGFQVTGRKKKKPKD